MNEDFSYFPFLKKLKLVEHGNLLNVFDANLLYPSAATSHMDSIYPKLETNFVTYERHDKKI